MAISRYVADADRFDSISMALKPGFIFDEFYDCQPLADSWKPIPVYVDSGPVGPGDFPSFKCRAPVFSERAWDLLRPYVGNVAEALPLIYPDDRKYFVLNVLELVDCLDPSESVIDRYSDGGISHVEHYVFHPERLRNKHFFKIPETAGLEVLVSDEFIQAVNDHGLKGAVFQQLG